MNLLRFQQIKTDNLPQFYQPPLLRNLNTKRLTFLQQDYGD